VDNKFNNESEILDDDLVKVTGGAFTGINTEKRMCSKCKKITDHRVASGGRCFCTICNTQN